MNEREWVQATLNGNKDAFASIVAKYQVAVFNLAFRLLGNATDAEDAAQESFVRAYTHLARYDPDRSFPTWLLSIAAHHCIDILRRSRRFRTKPVDDSHEIPAGDDPERCAVDGERNSEIRQALDLLPDHYRVIVVLHYWYDMSCREIGRVVGLSEGVVKVRLHRARGMLAQRITKESGPAKGMPREGTVRPKETGNHALFESRGIDVA